MGFFTAVAAAATTAATLSDISLSLLAIAKVTREGGDAAYDVMDAGESIKWDLARRGKT
jgi:hypothetical protein